MSVVESLSSASTAPSFASFRSGKGVRCDSTFSHRSVSLPVETDAVGTDHVKSIIDFLHRNASSLLTWTAFALVGALLFYIFSDGNFSLLMTLSSFTSLLSFSFIALRVINKRSVDGISLNMFLGYGILLVARLTSITMFSGYLPFDSSGDWLYPSLEVLKAAMAIAICVYGWFFVGDTRSENEDRMWIWYLATPAFLISLALHPSLNDFKPTDIAWAFALYLEAVVVLPQLYVFQQLKKVDHWVAHFIMAQALSNIMVFCFWICTWHELNTEVEHPVRAYVGHWVMLVQVLGLLVSGDLIYHYLKCYFSNESMDKSLWPATYSV